MALALFDLDNTLIAGDSDHAWGEFIVEQGLVDATEYQRENDRFYALYQQGKLDIGEYLAFSLSVFAQHPRQKLLQLRQQFMQEKIYPMHLQKAQTVIEDHRQRGDRVVIITSTNRFITEPIAQWLGINDLLATELEEKNDCYTGKAEGTPCFREGKITHLKSWLQSQTDTIKDSIFYSDSANDIPLLEFVDNAIAVDPDPDLRNHANQNQWQIMSFRNDDTSL